MSGIDRDTYFALLAEDPIAAANYVDAIRYQHQNPVGVISAVVNTTLAQQEAAVAEQFIRSHDDFPAGDQNAAELMRSKVQELVSEGMRFNETTLEYAYFSLLKEGKLMPEQEHNEPERHTPAGQTPEELLADADKLSDAELERVLRQNNMFR